MLRLWRKKIGAVTLNTASGEPLAPSLLVTPGLLAKSSLIDPTARGVAVEIAGMTIPLDFTNRHERDYFVRKRQADAIWRQ